jgi:hypothetical protein
MSSARSRGEGTPTGDHTRDFDDAEKGLYDNTKDLAVVPPLAHVNRRTSMHIDTFLSPMSPLHEGITPSSSMPVLTLSWPSGWKPPKPANPAVPELSPARRRWILFQLWFNTYRKFFTFVTLLNLVGIIMAALGRFKYAQHHLGALVLGNLLCAILMRNELFLRFLYIIAIYGLRSVRPCPFLSI